jgi:hypothetical protein
MFRAYRAAVKKLRLRRFGGSCDPFGVDKLVLLSIVISVIAIPTMAARDRSPRRGFKRAAALFGAACVLYVLALKYLYFRLL